MHLGRSLLPKQRGKQGRLFMAYTHTHTTSQGKLFSSLNIYMQKNTNLAKAFAPWTTYIYKKYRARKTIHCSYFALFWQHKKLDASWPPCQFGRAQGCQSSAEQHLPCQWPSANSAGVILGQRRERTAPVSDSKPTRRFQLAISSVWVRSSDS